MKISKKVTDFIVLEEGNIGRKAAVVTGAVLASSVLGLALTTEVAKAWYNYCDAHYDNPWNNVHVDTHTNSPHYNYSDDYWTHDPYCL